MRLLVVGASGFIGRNIVRLASKGGWEVAGTYWKSKDFPRFAREYGCQAIRANLLSRVKSQKADSCIFLAGNSDHRTSIELPLEDLRLNVEALHRFLEAYRNGIVFMSSAAVYEGMRGLVSPKKCVSPLLPYAISKLTCERYLQHFVSRGRLPWTTTLRLYYAYGPYDRETRLFPRLIKAFEEEKPFVITAPETSLLDPLYVEDVATASLSAATGVAENATLDLCSGSPKPVSSLAQQLIRTMDWRVQVVTRPSRTETPLLFFSQSEAARNALHLRKPIPLHTGFQRYLRWRRHQAGS